MTAELYLPESDKHVIDDIHELCRTTQDKLREIWPAPTSDAAEARRRNAASRALIAGMLETIERDYSKAWAEQARRYFAAAFPSSN